MAEVATAAKDGTLTTAGWPRPIIDGFPIPWVSPVENLGKTDPDRILETKERSLCQVCGEPFSDSEDELVVVFVDGGPKSQKPLGSVDLEKVLCRAMDDAVMHLRCAKLAAGRCPCLRRLREEKRFMALVGSVSEVKEYDTDEEERDPERRATFTFLALDGSAATEFDVGALPCKAQTT
jgi:hypothetical protein